MNAWNNNYSGGANSFDIFLIRIGNTSNGEPLQVPPLLPNAGDEHRVLSNVSFRYVQYRCDQRPKPNAAQRMCAIGSDVEF